VLCVRKRREVEEWLGGALGVEGADVVEGLILRK